MDNILAVLAQVCQRDSHTPTQTQPSPLDPLLPRQSS